MRKKIDKSLRLRRIRHPRVPTISEDPKNNAYLINSCVSGSKLILIVSDGMGWDHVSVSIDQESRLPTWLEMSMVKDIFFDAEECVLQFHPPKSTYVNLSETLHLWKPQDEKIPMPDLIMV